MAVYTYSEEAIDRAVRKISRMRVWMRMIAVACLAVEIVVAFGLNLRLSVPWSTAAFIVPIVLLTQGIGSWRAAPKLVVKHMRAYSVDVSFYSVRVQGAAMPQQQLTRDEILRVEEPSWGGGLYLRSTNRYRWLLIPRNLDGYGHVKDELKALGIPFARKVVPTNWEEFALVLFFCGSILCDMVTHNRQVLFANLAVALIVGFCGFFIISANPDNASRMRWTRFAAFLPAVFAAVSLYL